MTTIPVEMTFIRIERPGPPEVLVPDRMAVPVPGAGEVLIKVAAAGINRPDVLQRQGAYPPPPGASDVPASRSRARSWPWATASTAGGSATGSWRWSAPAATPSTAWHPRRRCCRSLPGCRWSRRAATRDLLHRLEQRVRSRPPAARRELPRPWRLVGDRHHRDPTRPRLRRHRVRDRGQRRQAARLRGAGRGERSTTAARTSWR